MNFFSLCPNDISLQQSGWHGSFEETHGVLKTEFHWQGHKDSVHTHELVWHGPSKAYVDDRRVAAHLGHGAVYRAPSMLCRNHVPLERPQQTAPLTLGPGNEESQLVFVGHGFAEFWLAWMGFAAG